MGTVTADRPGVTCLTAWMEADRPAPALGRPPLPSDVDPRPAVDVEESRGQAGAGGDELQEIPAIELEESAIGFGTHGCRSRNAGQEPDLAEHLVRTHRS